MYKGHSSVTVTYDRYGHWPENEDEAGALLDAYIERANTRARLAALWVGVSAWLVTTRLFAILWA